MRAALKDNAARHGLNGWVALLLAAGLVLAIALRIAFLGEENDDYVDFHAWLTFIREHGGFSALEFQFSNYTPLYSYFLLVGDWLHFDDHLVIKWVPLVCDFVVAFFVYKIVRLRYSVRSAAPAAAAVVTLLAPTVVLNSSYWGQADSVWVAGLVACVYFLAVERTSLAFLSFAIAYAFKQQAVFLAPLLLIVLLRKKASWWQLAWIPAVYGVLALPAALAGRPLGELARIYLGQTSYSERLSMNAPNPYIWLPRSLDDTLFKPSVVISALVVLAFVAWVARMRLELTLDRLLLIATISCLLVPYVLPHMHDRYFFAADVLAIALAFCDRSKIWAAVTIQAVSFFAYLPFLFHREPIPLELLSVVLLAVIVLLCRSLAQDSTRPREQEASA